MPTINSPLSGRVVSLCVTPNSIVASGDPLMIVESMKMEIPVEAECHGVIKTLFVAEGEEVAEGQALVELQ